MYQHVITPTKLFQRTRRDDLQARQGSRARVCAYTGPSTIGEEYVITLFVLHEKHKKALMILTCELRHDSSANEKQFSDPLEGNVGRQNTSKVNSRKAGEETDKRGPKEERPQSS